MRSVPQNLSLMQEQDESERPHLEGQGTQGDSQDPAAAQQPQEEEEEASAAEQTPEAEFQNGSDGDDGPESSVEEEGLAAFLAAFQELRKWVDTNDAQYAALHANYEAWQGRPASGIK